VVETFSWKELTMSVLVRILSKVKVNAETGCWEWQGSRVHGYGQIGVGVKLFRAHRLVYEIATGVDPGKKCVCHCCDNPCCVNHEYLFLGTQKENLIDCSVKDRCPIGEKHGHAKLTEVDVRNIRAIHACNKKSQRALVSIYGVSPSVISNVINRKAWKHVVG